jgi:hypothetical protein
VFCDSVQLGDRPEWNDSMANFGERTAITGRISIVVAVTTAQLVSHSACV